MQISANGAAVGRVIGLWRYPVKSMAAEPLTEADVSWHGFAGDRRWAFVRQGLERSGFPWLTMRERSDLDHYRPSFLDPARPDKSPTVVRTPSGETLDVADPSLAAELMPGARVIRQDRGIFDTFPLSLITVQTIGRLGDIVRRSLETARFRPNILVDVGAARPFAEDDWVGCVLRLGTARVRIDKRDGRCAVITIDPETTERDPAILRAVADQREGCLGVYGTTVQPGRIALNDPIVVESTP